MRNRTAAVRSSLLLLALVALALLAAPSVPAQQDHPARPLFKRLERIEKRLERIEEHLEKERRAQPEAAAPREIRRALAELRRDLLGELRAVVGGGCTAHHGTIGGRREVVVLVAGTWLRFLEVASPVQPVTVGLDQELARALYSQAQSQIGDALLPTVYRAVPAVALEVPPFFLQDRLVTPELRRRLGFGQSAERVSLHEAQGLVAALNELCAGEVRFELPTEEQMLVAARMIYDPRPDLLRPCREVAALAADSRFSDLLGARWQLTRSPCRPFGRPTADADACPEGTYVIKGGTAGSTNALECIPEYRDAVPPTVAAQDTAVRLVIAP